MEYYFFLRREVREDKGIFSLFETLLPSDISTLPSLGFRNSRWIREVGGGKSAPNLAGWAVRCSAAIVFSFSPIVVESESPIIYIIPSPRPCFLYTSLDGYLILKVIIDGTDYKYIYNNIP